MRLTAVRSSAPPPAYHGLVVEGEALQLPQGVGGGGELFEDDEGLPPHLRRLHGHDVDDLPELREERVERALQLCGTNRTSAEPDQTKTLRQVQVKRSMEPEPGSFLLTFLLDFIVDVVDVDRVIGSDVHPAVWQMTQQNRGRTKSNAQV